MKKCRGLSLMGYGIVQDLDLTQDQATLRIEVASLSPDASALSIEDKIIIQCTANCSRLRKRLQTLDRQYPAIEGVTAWFQVQFLRIDSCHPRATPGHSPYVLKFSAELIAIENWLRDGMYAGLK